MSRGGAGSRDLTGGIQLRASLALAKDTSFIRLHKCTAASPNGSIIDDKGSLLYLGGTLTSSAGSHSELSRRLGLGGGGFHALRKLWNHGNVSQRKKLHYFQSLVMSVLTYGLSTLAFTRVQKRRMDGFHARCLRRILRIPTAFVSRVANRVVFERAQVKPLSQQLLDRQLLLFGRIFRAGIGDPVRKYTLTDLDTNYFDAYIRRQGRPCTNWVDTIWKDGAEKFGSPQRFLDSMRA